MYIEFAPKDSFLLAILSRYPLLVYQRIRNDPSNFVVAAWTIAKKCCLLIVTYHLQDRKLALKRENP